VACAIETGALLIEAKKRVGHGNFERWVANNCELSPATARRWMELADKRPELEKQLTAKTLNLSDLNLSSARRLIALPPPPKQDGSGQEENKSKPKPPATEQYKQIETNLINCLKDLREKAESYAANTIEALNDTVSDIKSMIEQAQARRMRAEAAALEATGETLVIPEKLWPEATARQLARMEIDPWEEVLGSRLANMEADNRQGHSGCYNRVTDERDNVIEWRVSSNFLLATVLSIPQERQTNNHTKRLAGIMRGLGWTRSETTMRIGKLVCRGFVKSCSVTHPSAGVTGFPSGVAPKLAVLDGGKEKKPQEKDVTGETLKRRML
jgi:hypothetical protein